ncbi:MAG: hypothetical protein ACE5QV_03200, partial [Fidelibacterota bacterium]
VLLTGGGIIPRKYMEKLKQMGVGRLFGPGTPLKECIDYVISWVRENRLKKTTDLPETRKLS